VRSVPGEQSRREEDHREEGTREEGILVGEP